jgi:hypothetical protein
MKKMIGLIAGAMLATMQVYAGNIFVKPDGAPSTGTGSSWASAISYQRAFQIAKTGDVIYLAKGTYYVEKACHLRDKALTVVGGFSGAEKEATIRLSMSKPEANPTVFTSKDPLTYRIFDVLGSNKFTDQKFVMSGITFKDIVSNQYGTAIQVYTPDGNTMPIEFTNCKFVNMKAIDSTGKKVAAGAVYINRKNSANITFTKCSFTDISSTGDAGAVYIANGPTNNVAITFKDCNFTNVSCADGAQGSAIQAVNATSVADANGQKTTYPYTLDIENCTFKACKGGAASHGGKNATNGVISAGNGVQFNFNTSIIN